MFNRRAQRRRERHKQAYRAEITRQRQVRLEATIRSRTPECPASCHRKLAWPDRQTAEGVLEEMRQTKHMVVEPHPYQCPHCKLWYLGREYPEPDDKKAPS